MDQLWDPKSILEGRPISTSTTTTKSSFENFVDMFVKPTRRRPWLWGVYVLIIVLPVLIIIAACWLLQKPERKKISSKIKKKNDDYADDDEEEVEYNQREVKFKRNPKDALEKPSSISRKSRRRTRRE